MSPGVQSHPWLKTMGWMSAEAFFSAQTSTGLKAEKGRGGCGPTHMGEATLALNLEKFPH